MNILFVCENYYPHYGGAEVVFKNLAEGYVKLGHKVNLITSRLKGTAKFEIINGIKVHRVNCFNNRYLFSFLAIPKVIKLARKADVIQTTTFNGAPPAWLAAKVRRKKVILTVHEVWVNKWSQVTNLGAVSRFIHNFLEKAIYLLKYDHYICVSNATRKDLLKINIDPKKATTIHNGLDYSFWNEKNFPKVEGLKIREKLATKNNFVIFSWGRPGESKGFEYLIRAMPKIIKQIPNAVLLLMLGSTDKYPARTRLIKDLVDDTLKKITAKSDNKEQTNKAVRIIPSAPYETLGKYIVAGDCVVVPSIAEGFGYNAVEAATLDIPVLVSDAGSLPEVISGKHQIFQSKNVEDLANKVVAIKNSKFNQTPLKKFYWERTIEEYLTTYKDVLKKTN